MQCRRAGGGHNYHEAKGKQMPSCAEPKLTILRSLDNPAPARKNTSGFHELAATCGLFEGFAPDVIEIHHLHRGRRGHFLGGEFHTFRPDAAIRASLDENHLNGVAVAKPFLVRGGTHSPRSRFMHMSNCAIRSRSKCADCEGQSCSLK